MTTEGADHTKHREYGQTDTEKFSVDYKWTINDFTCLYQHNLIIRSPLFEIPSYPMTGVVELVKMYCSETYYTQGEVTVQLTSHSVPLVIRTKIFALSSTGAELDLGEEYSTNNSTKSRICLHFKTPACEFREGTYVENRTITILCSITVIRSFLTLARSFPLPEESLSSHLTSLLSGEKYSDITISMGTKTFKAHKLMLAARSPVFAAMFEHKLTEDSTNNIDVTDINEEVMEQLLRYIYTDKIDHIEDMAMELLHAAEKYDIKNLKSLCGPYLQLNLDTDNAAERLMIADRYNVIEVRNYILKFMIGNRKKVMLTDGYKAMEKAHPNFVLEAKEFAWDN